MQNVAKLRRLGLEAYQKEGAPSHWLLPVCAAFPGPLERLGRLPQRHSGNWETADIDGIPHRCYRLTTAQIRMWNRNRFRAAFAMFADTLGKEVVRAFWPDLFIRWNNETAKARNTWEKHHGGYRRDSFNRGMSARAAAPLSIT